MNAILNTTLRMKIWTDTRGQDLMENALLGGFLAAASGATLPKMAGAICGVLAKVGSVVALQALRIKACG